MSVMWENNFELRWLNVNMETHAREKAYKSQLCQKSFTEGGNLRSHMKIHTGEKPYQCQVCQKSFTEGGKLKRHMKIHPDEKPYQCKVCQKSFTEGDYLKVHMRTHILEKPYKCHLCQTSFTQFGTLKTHMRTHTGEKPFQCQVCQKKITKSSNLNTHMRTHTGEKPYKCHLCQKSFTLRGHMKRHMTAHTGMKPYKCQLCQKLFTQASSLKVHNRSHTGKCQLRQKAFLRDGHLNRHMRTHPDSDRTRHTGTFTAERPYICEVGDKGLGSLIDLIQHRTHTDEMQHMCSKLYCNGSSSTKQHKCHELIQRKDYELENESNANLSVPFIRCSADDIHKPFERMQRKLPDCNEMTITLSKSRHRGFDFIDNIETPEDVKTFVENSFGCGICDEMFELEKEFLEHCTNHRFSPVDELFADLC